MPFGFRRLLGIRNQGNSRDANSAFGSRNGDDTSSQEYTKVSVEEYESDPAVAALCIFKGIPPSTEFDRSAAFLGAEGPRSQEVLESFMSQFEWADEPIISALRILSSRISLTGESQQIDRVVQAMAARWVSCNPNHGFISASIVHGIAFSLLLLNTDLHQAQDKTRAEMSKKQYVNQMRSLTRKLVEHEQQTATEDLFTSKSSTPARAEANKPRTTSLVNQPANTFSRGDWNECLLGVIKLFYVSISNCALAFPESHAASERASTIGDAPSVTDVESAAPSGTGKSASRTVSRGSGQGIPQLTVGDATSTVGGTTLGRNSGENLQLHEHDEQLDSNYESWDFLRLLGPPWAKEGPLQVETFAKLSQSMRKKHKSRWVEVFAVIDRGQLRLYSFRPELTKNINQRLGSTATGTGTGSTRTNGRADKAYATSFAPSQSKTTKGRDSAVGGSAASLRRGSDHRSLRDSDSIRERSSVLSHRDTNSLEGDENAESDAAAAAAAAEASAVGDGNWTAQAQLLQSYILTHSLAQVTDQKSSKGEWSLLLSGGRVLCFKAGTTETAEEYVNTCNYWAARLSKPPLIGMVTSTEYGWGRPLELVSTGKESISGSGQDGITIAGEKVIVYPWTPQQDSDLHSGLSERDQLVALQGHVDAMDAELAVHNAQLGAMLRIFTKKLPVSARAHGNWQARSQYLLKQSVQYTQYIKILDTAITEGSSRGVNVNAVKHSQPLSEAESSSIHLTRSASGLTSTRSRGSTTVSHASVGAALANGNQPPASLSPVTTPRATDNGDVSTPLTEGDQSVGNISLNQSITTVSPDTEASQSASQSPSHASHASPSIIQSPSIGSIKAASSPLHQE